MYCIGAAKSGTSSLAGVLETGFRAAHEPQRAELLDAVMALDTGRLGPSELNRYLCERDHRLRLEFDSSWANYFVMDRLATLFQDAKFIQLIRDCYTWVESVINHLIARTIPSDVQDFLDWWFEPSKFPYKRSDRGLEEIGVYSLDCFVTRWSIHAEGPAQVIPADRLMTIRTPEIPASAQRLADFLGVSVDLIDRTKSHRNKGNTIRPLLGLVDKAYLDDTVARICRDSMNRYFPEVRNSDDTSLAR
ncbi:MAG: hypothetical protein OXG43_09745 [Chloroflexi bacterium]|nr:hypothetical protein [Chloroflexota bacterium]